MLAPGIHRFEPDERVTVYIDPRHLMVFDQSGRAVRPATALAA